MRGEKTDLWETIRAGQDGRLEALRRDIFNDVVDGHTLDTCDTVDAGWETGINPPNKPRIIVESYKSRDVAEKGHAKWVAYVKGGGRDFPDNQP